MENGFKEISCLTYMILIYSGTYLCQRLRLFLDDAADVDDFVRDRLRQVEELIRIHKRQRHILSDFFDIREALPELVSEDAVDHLVNPGRQHPGIVGSQEEVPSTLQVGHRVAVDGSRAED